VNCCEVIRDAKSAIDRSDAGKGRIVTMRILSRRTFWLSTAILLLAIVVSFLAPRSRINQENFERMQVGMCKSEIEAILGEADRPKNRVGFSFVWQEYGFWSSGPNWIEVYFENRDQGLSRKTLHLATLGETLQWYAKKGAEKAGIEWQ
jgi:hypothetical protein